MPQKLVWPFDRIFKVRVDIGLPDCFPQVPNQHVSTLASCQYARALTVFKIETSYEENYLGNQAESIVIRNEAQVIQLDLYIRGNPKPLNRHYALSV